MFLNILPLTKIIIRIFVLIKFVTYPNESFWLLYVLITCWSGVRYHLFRLFMLYFFNCIELWGCWCSFWFLHILFLFYFLRLFKFLIDRIYFIIIIIFLFSFLLWLFHFWCLFFSLFLIDFFLYLWCLLFVSFLT